MTTQQIADRMYQGWQAARAWRDRAETCPHWLAGYDAYEAHRLAALRRFWMR